MAGHMTTIHIYYFSCYKITVASEYTLSAISEVSPILFRRCKPANVSALSTPSFFCRGTPDNTRCNCIHPDIMFSEFGCQLFSESMNTTFACYGSCGRETGDSMINQHGSNIDDRAATIVDHR
jgi:hypothetical protein